MENLKRIDESLEFTVSLTRVQRDYYKRNPAEEVWANNEWIVHVRRSIKIMVDSQFSHVTHLSIRRDDRSARPDWRAFQWIKNQLVGEENEGVEIFPAESRLVDGANQFHLWVYEDSEFRVPFGFNERCVTDKDDSSGATQRKFPQNRLPSDNDKNAEAISSAYVELNKDTPQN